MVLKPLVSILIPAFNAEAWIAESLQSALAQTWEPKEIIVVDDGSSDRTLAIAEEFHPKGIRVLTQKNEGAPAARNRALSASNGDYIQWLDADDLLAPDKIAAQMAIVDLTSNRRMLLSSEFGRFMYRHYRAKFIPTALWGDLSPVEFVLRKMEQNLFMQTSVWLVSRELTEATGPWNTQMLADDDGEYFCRVMLASNGIRFVPDARVYYRASGPKRLSYIGLSDRKLDAQWLSMQLQIGYLRSLEDSDRTRAACLQYLQTWLIYFYPERSEIVRQFERTAKELGGELEVPRLSWKYSWIQKTFGWRMAKRARLFMPQVRRNMESSWDKMLFFVESRKRPGILVGTGCEKSAGSPSAFTPGLVRNTNSKAPEVRRES